MANDKVMFKRGSQANLATATIVNGAFYLTDDTNRLYIGKDGKAVPVNQGVITVKNVTYLPGNSNAPTEKAEQGQFYYSTTENVLCIKSGDSWVQINPDTDTKITRRAIASEANAASNFVTVTDSVFQKTNTGSMESEYASKFAVKGGAGVTVTVEEVTEGDTKYPRLVITPAAYSLTAAIDDNAGTVEMTMTNGSATSKVTATAGANVTIAKKADNSFVISAKDTTLKSDSFTLGFDADGKLTASVSDTSATGNTASASITPTIQYGVEENGSASNNKAKFDANGNLLLSVYTASQVDAKFQGLDAMVYKGTIKELPSVDDGVSAGDTYKVSDDKNSININGVQAKKGDVVIARGTEVNGVISGTITWDLIPAGDDSLTDTHYDIQNIENGIQLIEDVTGKPVKGGIQIAGNDYLTITDNDGADVNVVTVAHNETLSAGGTTTSKAEAEVNQVKGKDFKFSIPVLEYNKAGHITKVSAQEYTLKDTIAQFTLKSMGATDASSNYTSGALASSATISTTLSDITGDVPVDHTKAFNITSSSLVLAKDDAGNLAMDIEWGSF